MNNAIRRRPFPFRRSPLLRGISLCLFVAGISGCRGPVYRFNEGAVFGTTYHITYNASGELGPEIRQELERVNASLSMFDPESVISRINRNEDARVDSLFLLVFRKAVEVYAATGGAFDMTVAPLTNAWGFGLRQGALPDSARIQSLLSWVGMDKLSLEGDRLTKANDSIQLDASAIAKGLGVDLVAQLLDRRGVNDYLVEVGGEVRVKGVNRKGLAWRIGIDFPLKESDGTRRLAGTIAISRGALATSGNYRNYREIEGKEYGHTIDPHTGYPVQQDLLSASIYTASCMEADAYATACMVLGWERSRELVERNGHLEACLIYLDAEGKPQKWSTKGFTALMIGEK